MIITVAIPFRSSQTKWQAGRPVTEKSSSVRAVVPRASPPCKWSSARRMVLRENSPRANGLPCKLNRIAIPNGRLVVLGVLVLVLSLSDLARPRED
jgi:hypothetical protein